MGDSLNTLHKRGHIHINPLPAIRDEDVKTMLLTLRNITIRKASHRKGTTAPLLLCLLHVNQGIIIVHQKCGPAIDYIFVPIR